MSFGILKMPRYFLLFLTISTVIKISNGHDYGKGLLNHTGCLYSYLEGGNFEMTTADGDVIDEKLELDSLNYDSTKTRCTNLNEPGKLTFSFRVDEKSKIKSIVLGMRIVPSSSEGYWEVSSANLTIMRADVDRKRTFQLRVEDIYAGLRHSFSCNELVLHTLHKKKLDNETGRIEPHAKVTIDRFQLQPFPELDDVIFAASFDCSTWISLPGLMGFILILFMTSVVIIGVYFLKKIETNVFKNQKEGQLFTQSQMESQKHR